MWNRVSSQAAAGAQIQHAGESAAAAGEQNAELAKCKDECAQHAAIAEHMSMMVAKQSEEMDTQSSQLQTLLAQRREGHQGCIDSKATREPAC